MSRCFFAAVAIALLCASVVPVRPVAAQPCDAGDALAPLVTIEQPAALETVLGNTLPRLRGSIVEAGALSSVVLEVAGPQPQTLPLDSFVVADPARPGLYRFEVTEIPLAAGDNRLTIRATDRACTAHSASAERVVSSATPPSPLNLYALGIEVTQATQGKGTEDGLQTRGVARADAVQPSLVYDGGTLIAGKRTVVRAYAEAEGAVAAFAGAYARLRVRRGGEVTELFSGDIVLDPADDVFDGPSLDVDRTLFNKRGRVRGSWDFVLPYAVTAAGSIARLELVVNPSGTGSIAECSGCNDQANVLRVEDVPFRESRPLRVRPFHYESGSHSPADGAELTTFCETFSRWMPVADGCGLGLGIDLRPPLSVDLTSIDELGVAAPNVIEVENNVCSMMSVDRDASSSSFEGPTLYYGLLPASLATTGPDAFGSSVDGHPHLKACAAGPELAPGATSDRTAIVSQEVAHGFLHADISGLGHVAWHACGGRAAYQLPSFPTYNDPSGSALPPASIGQFGLDTWSGQLYSPETAIDFLGSGYCDGTAWISPYTWELLGEHFASAASALEASLLAGAAEDLAYPVTGFLDGSGGLHLAPLFALPRPITLTQPLPGNLFFILRNAAGTPLFAVPFGLNGHPDLPGGGTFAFGAPFIEGTARIDVQRDNRVLLSIPLSAHAPEVALDQPAGGSLWNEQTTATVAWHATDADGDDLRYLVQYSADGGSRWRTLASGLTATSLTVDVSALEASAEARVRIFATDGARTSGDTSGLLVVEAGTPRLQVSAPSVVVDRQSVLGAIAGYTNIDDPTVRPEAIQWQKDGSTVSVGPRTDLKGSDLAAGRHTLTAIAPDNAEGDIRRTLEVLRAPTFAELTAPAPTCAGDCDISEDVTVDEIITGVNIALGTLPIDNCNAMDTSGDDQVTVDEILRAVQNALQGCGSLLR